MNEVYWKFVESERHFNTTQAGIRTQAATWILAAFAAIAILLKSEDKVAWLVSPPVLVGIVSIMASFGLLVLWINDQLVYQRLLDCGFVTALKMEYDNPSLPPIRAMMMYAAEGKGMGRWMTYFYTIPMWGFLAISIVATLLRKSITAVRPGAGLDYSLAVLILICVAQLAAVLWVLSKRKQVGAKERAALFGDNSFARLFDGTAESLASLEQVIKRYRMPA